MPLCANPSNKLTLANITVLNALLESKFWLKKMAQH